MNNVAGLWDNDTIKDHHPDETDGGSSIGGIHRRSSVTNSRPTSSLILDDDVTPPLPWKEPVGQFAATDRLSASKRFSMDAIADVGGKTEVAQARWLQYELEYGRLVGPLLIRTCLCIYIFFDH